jgi:hypothetical protein
LTCKSHKFICKTTPDASFSVSDTRRYSGLWRAKHKDIDVKSIYSGLMVQPNRAIRRWPDRRSRRNSTDHSSWKPAPPLSFPSSVKSLYAPFSCYTQTQEQKIAQTCDSTSICMKSWYIFMMNMIVPWSSLNGSSYLGRRLRTWKE